MYSSSLGRHIFRLSGYCSSRCARRGTLLEYLAERLDVALDSFFTWQNERFKTKRLTPARLSGMGSSSGELSNGEPQEVEPNLSLIWQEAYGRAVFCLVSTPTRCPLTMLRGVAAP
jgi:hypothetical protein